MRWKAIKNLCVNQSQWNWMSLKPFIRKEMHHKEIQILAQQKATLQEEMEALRQEVESSKARLEQEKSGE